MGHPGTKKESDTPFRTRALRTWRGVRKFVTGIISVLCYAGGLVYFLWPQSSPFYTEGFRAWHMIILMVLCTVLNVFVIRAEKKG